MRFSLFPVFWAAAWFGVLLSLAGLLWKAARWKLGVGAAALSLLYGLGLLLALLPPQLRRAVLLPGPQDFPGLYHVLSAGRWRVGRRSVPLWMVLAVCWLAVSCVLLARYLSWYCRAARSIRRHAAPADGRAQLLLRRLMQEQGRRVPVSVLMMPGIDTPYGFGLLHRRILLPEIAYTDAELACILRHEYTHFRRHDILSRQLALLFGIAYWWSPAAWLLRGELEQAIELRCDAAATRHMDKMGRVAYLRAVMDTLKAGASGQEDWESPGLWERFSAVLTGGEPGGAAPAETEEGGCAMIKRSWLYLTRKYQRSILLLLLLFVISSSISVGLCVWNSIGGVTREIEQAFGTGFRLKVPSFFRSDPSYCVQVPGADGNMTLAYAGPKLDDTIIGEIRKVEGVTRYDAELDYYVMFDSGKLFPGLFTSVLNNWEHINHNDGETREKQDALARETMVYGHTNTSLSADFRTGSFSLVEGRHITEGEQWKVLISDKVAELNGLRVGDSISVSLRNGMGGYPDFFHVIGEVKQLEIVGIFHVNGFQPETEWVPEMDSTYNHLIADLTTAVYFRQMAYVSQYGSPLDDVLYDNLTFFVEDPAKLDEVMRTVKALDTIDISSLEFSTDDTMYKSTVTPLKSIRNLVVGLVAVIVAGCAVVLCVVFTMWVRGRRQEIAVYLSMGFGKASIIGQLILEAAVVALAAAILSFAACQRVPGLLGNWMLAAAVEDAQPQEQAVTREEIHEAIQAGTFDQLYRYESSDYARPEQIDFTFRATDFLLLLLLELLLIVGAVCKGGSFLFRLQPRQILADFR